MPRPFRFIAPLPSLALPRARFRDALQHIEDLGFDSVAVSEHLGLGWWMEPMTALTAAALANERLKLLTLVLSNDFRHPVMLHKTAAMLDVLSDGRLELGVGAGWMAEDFVAAGIPFDRPSIRIARLAESVHVLKGLFGSSPFTFDGQYYQVRGLAGAPAPRQQPHPPLLIGGGGRRILQLAAAEADIVGIHPSLKSGTLDQVAAADLACERMAEKVDWVRAAAAAAGRDAHAIELQLSIYWCQVTDSGSTSREATSVFSELIRADPRLVERSPAVLVGSVQQCVHALCERRERFGFSYIKLSGDVDAVAPIVARLAGT